MPVWWGFFFCVKIICKFFLKTPEQNGNFSPYSRGSFFERCFSFWFSLSKIFSRINWKEVFVCAKIAAVNFFFCRTKFLMNGYRQMNLLFILFSFVQRTRQGKVLVGAYDCEKLFDVCIHLQKSFAFAGKRRVHNDLKTVYRRRAKEQSIHGQQDLMHRALGFIDKEYERLWFGNFMIFETKIDSFWVGFEAKFKPPILWESHRNE